MTDWQYFLKWLTEGGAALLTLVMSVVTASVAFAAYRVSRASSLVSAGMKDIADQQRHIAQQKLRLDLYNRRFVVFTALIDFHNALASWENTPEQKAVSMKFLTVKEESRFLFSDESGIYVLLDDLWKRSWKVTGFLNHKDVWKSDPQAMLDGHNTVATILFKEHDEAFVKLREAMKPYLDFHEI